MNKVVLVIGDRESDPLSLITPGPVELGRRKKQSREYKTPSLAERMMQEISVERIDRMLSDLKKIEGISPGTMKRIERAAEARKKELLAEQEKGTVSSTEQG